jgi:hypothetical protein
MWHKLIGGPPTLLHDFPVIRNSLPTGLCDGHEFLSSGGSMEVLFLPFVLFFFLIKLKKLNKQLLVMDFWF